MNERFSRLLGLLAIGAAAACSGSTFKADGAAGVSGAGGSSSKGGSSSSSGGKSSSTGGSGNTSGGMSQGGVSSVGGASTEGGSPPVGGSPTTGGSSPIGGSPPMAGSGGDATAGTGGTINGMPSTTPLVLADLELIDSTNLDGFHAAGFRCKSLTVCGVGQTCIYYEGRLGSVQATEVFLDGDMLGDGQAIKIQIGNGAKAECATNPVAIDDGESIILTYGGVNLVVYFPAFQGTDLTLYVADDGSTYYDQQLTELARANSL